MQLSPMLRPLPHIARLCALSAITLLFACETKTVRVVDMTPPKQALETPAEAHLLDVGVALFDPNVPDDYDERIEELIMPEVRNAEAKFIPYTLKNLLQSTGNWGAVRVIPRDTLAVDVVVNGKILHSDGASMTLEIEVKDATGTIWFTREYEALASKYAYGTEVPQGIDAFYVIYKQIADDMLAYMEALPPQTNADIRHVAEMRFAKDFSAEAFQEHVASSPDGNYQIRRLPAEGDPMLERVRRIREREYLFIDTLDEFYTNFHTQMYPSYQNWRRASYEQVILFDELEAQARTRTIGGTLAIVGGIASIYESDNGYVDAGGLVSIVGGATLINSAIQRKQEAAVQAEKIRELGSAAEAELIPSTIELENQTARLQGTVEEQYEQLRGILRRVYFEELNLPVPEAAESPAEPVDGAT